MRANGTQRVTLPRLGSLLVLGSALMVGCLVALRQRSPMQATSAPPPIATSLAGRHLPSNTFLEFIEDHSGAVSAIGIFGGFSGLMGAASVAPYLVAAFGFLVLLVLDQLRASALCGEEEPFATFRSVLNYLMLILFLAWALAMAQLRPSLGLLPPLALLAWTFRRVEEVSWPTGLRRTAAVGLIVLFIPIALVFLGLSLLDVMHVVGIA